MGRWENKGGENTTKRVDGKSINKRVGGEYISKSVGGNIQIREWRKEMKVQIRDYLGKI